MNATGYTPEESIAAIATALSPAALGIIRVSGKNAIELVSQIFSRPQTLKTTPGNTVVYGWIQDSTNKFYKIDEVLVSVFRGPKSFTGEDMAEISCHGGIAVVTEIFKLLLKIGFRQANPGEFTFRAFINGKADLTKAEAVQEIVSAKTSDSRGHATDRLAGNLYREIDDIKHRKVTEEALKSADYDAVIYVSNCQYFGTNDEHNLLQILKNHVKTPIIFVLNQLDRFKQKEDSIAKMVKDYSYDLRKIGFNSPTICPLSAQAALLFKLPDEKLDEEDKEDKEKWEIIFKKEYYDLPSYVGVRDSKTVLDKTGITNLENQLLNI